MGLIGAKHLTERQLCQKTHGKPHKHLLTQLYTLEPTEMRKTPKASPFPTLQENLRDERALGFLESLLIFPKNVSVFISTSFELRITWLSTGNS